MHQDTRNGVARICMLLVFVVLSGCSGCPLFSSGGGSESSAVGAGQTKKLRAKLSQYSVKCINRHSNQIADQRKNYMNSLEDPKKGPTGDGSNVWAPFGIEIDRCVKAIKKAAEMPPDRTELEKAGEQYRKALTLLAPKLKKAEQYYDRGNYKDDNLKKGKKLHDDLVKGFQKFDKANEALSEKVDTLETELDEQLLERLINDDSKQIRYRVEKTRITAKRLAKIASDLELENRKLVGDKEKLIKTTKSLETNVNKLTKRLESGGSESTSKDYDSFSDAAEEALIEAKKLMRRVRDDKPFEKDELGQLDSITGPEGTPPKYLEKYNEMISTYNHL